MIDLDFVLKNFDLLVVGAGPVGCVIAERFANILNKKVLLIDKREHIAGNCYDSVHNSGVMIHNYGPHYFRTNKKDLIDYLSNFTDWIPGEYIVQSKYGDKLYPIPINLDTLEKFFGKSFDEKSAEAFLKQKRIACESPENSEQYVLSRVGPELYEAFYLGYTIKQWDRHPRELDKSVCGRVPIRMNRDHRYVDQKFQVTPAKGFTKMFATMIDHPLISLMLKSDFRTIAPKVVGKIPLVYTGPIDEYFNYSEGRLPWRSLEFEHKVFQQDYVQPCVQINYPSIDIPYTRSVEIKHVTKQKCDKTVVTYESSKAHGDPYYPIPAPENRVLFNKYWSLVESETKNKKVFFAGRLARYVYINTDEAIEEALNTFEVMRERLFLS